MERTRDAGDIYDERRYMNAIVVIGYTYRDQHTTRTKQVVIDLSTLETLSRGELEADQMLRDYDIEIKRALTELESYKQASLDDP